MIVLCDLDSNIKDLIYFFRHRVKDGDLIKYQHGVLFTEGEGDFYRDSKILDIEMIISNLEELYT